MARSSCSTDCPCAEPRGGPPCTRDKPCGYRIGWAEDRLDGAVERIAELEAQLEKCERENTEAYSAVGVAVTVMNPDQVQRWMAKVQKFRAEAASHRIRSAP